MKASREQQLAALLQPAEMGGVTLKRLDLTQPLEDQQPFHALLHKASDELEYDEDGVPRFSARIKGLQAYLATHPDIAVIDPFECTIKVIDRIQLASCLEGLQSLGETEAEPLGPRARAPRSLTLHSFTNGSLPSETLAARLQAAGMAPPYIVKPVAACGLKDSHSMALVLDNAALPGLALPLPAVVQEFVNHGGMQHKVYVMGDLVYSTCRPSIPDVRTAETPAPPMAASADSASTSGDCGGAASARSIVHYFDSLASLPTRLPDGFAAQLAPTAAEASASEGAEPFTSASSSGRPLDMAVVRRIVAYLRQRLGLRLMGFDVVVCCKSGDHLVVDVNYFPNYRDAPDGLSDVFRALLRAACAQNVVQRASR